MHHRKGDLVKTHEKFIIVSNEFSYPKYWWNQEHKYCLTCGKCHISGNKMTKVKNENSKTHVRSLFSLPQFSFRFDSPDKDDCSKLFYCSSCQKKVKEFDGDIENFFICLFEARNERIMDCDKKCENVNHLEEKYYLRQIERFFKDLEINYCSLSNNAIALKTSAAILYNVCVGKTRISHCCPTPINEANEENWLQSLFLSCENSNTTKKEVISDEEHNMILESWALLSGAVQMKNHLNTASHYWNLQFYKQIYFKTRESYLYSLNMTKLHPAVLYFQKVLPKLQQKSGNDELSIALKILNKPFLQCIFSKPRSEQNNNQDTLNITTSEQPKQQQKKYETQQKQLFARYAARLSQLATELIHQGVINDNGDNGYTTNPFSTFAQLGQFFCPSMASIAHSCLPNCAVQLIPCNIEKMDSCKTLTPGPIRIGLLALYDFHSEEELPSVNRLNDSNLSCSQRQEALRKIFQNPGFTCSCLLCRYESSQNNAAFTPRELQRLGDWYMQNPESSSQQYQDNSKLALSLYLRAIQKLQGTQLNQRTEEIQGLYASLAYSHGAWYLERGEFVRAQKVWKDYVADHQFPQDNNRELILQVQKHAVYHDLQSKHDNQNEGNNYGTSMIVSHQYNSYECILPQKIYITTQPIISNEQCNRIIHWAENHSNGWTTSRHYSVPTTDIPVHEMPVLLSWFRQEFFKKKLLPLLQSQFDIVSSQNLYIHDAFVVKYSCGGIRSIGQTHLPWHTDQSTLSFTLNLNDNYDGGGTYFKCLGKSIRPKTGCGHILSFRGDSLVHGGDPITSGKRYILVAFCYVDDTADETINAITENGDTISSSRSKRLANQFSHIEKKKKQKQENATEYSNESQTKDNQSSFVFRFNL